MPAVQPLLFPDPKPLVERLGRDFFRQLPRRAGVYLMRDGAGTILYVGKAKDLRQRLGSYRVANPDRVPKRLLRLLHAVEQIEYQECADEAAALRREAELLRELKPRFNRAGVWPAPPKVLAWRLEGEGIELGVYDQVPAGWNQHGPLKGGAMVMLVSLVRVFWVLACPERGLAGMPPGWFHGRLPECVQFPKVGGMIEMWLANWLPHGVSEAVQQEILGLLASRSSGWQFTLLCEDWEMVVSYFKPRGPSSIPDGSLI
jgi:predicted GIY-YIG superfamily endonuclease